MHCIECDKDCPMHTERYMDVQTPCTVCARGMDMPQPECWKCIKGNCQWKERDEHERNLNVQELF